MFIGSLNIIVGKNGKNNDYFFTFLTEFGIITICTQLVLKFSKFYGTQ